MGQTIGTPLRHMWLLDALDTMRYCQHRVTLRLMSAEAICPIVFMTGEDDPWTVPGNMELSTLRGMNYWVKRLREDLERWYIGSNAWERVDWSPANYVFNVRLGPETWTMADATWCIGIGGPNNNVVRVVRSREWFYAEEDAESPSSPRTP